MKTNKFTRLLAVLLSVLMVASSLPLVANAGDTQTGTISQSESVLVCNKDPQNRVNTTKGFNIINDSGTDNVTVGLWNYKFSSLESVSSATLTASLKDYAAINDSQSLSVKFYYLNPADLGSYITVSGGKNYTASFTTTKSDNQAMTVSDIESEFGVSQSNFIKEIPHSTSNGNYDLDVSAALNTAIANNWSGITFMAMQSSEHVGGVVNGTDNGWSDQWFTLGNINWSRTSVTADEMKALLDEYQNMIEGCTPDSFYTNLKNSYNAWIKAYRTYICVVAGTLDADSSDMGTLYINLKTEMDKMKSAGKWSLDKVKSTMQTSVDQYSSAQLVGGDEMANVLYYAGIRGQKSNQTDIYSGYTWPSSRYIRVSVQYGPAVLLYDGTGDNVGFPISMCTYKISGSDNSSNRARALWTTSEGLGFKHRWHGWTNNEGYQNVESNSYVGIEDGDMNSASEPNSSCRYSTTLYFTGDRSSFDDSCMKVYDQVGFKGQSAFETGHYGTFDLKSPIYVLNYAALLDEIKKVDFTTLLQYQSSQIQTMLGRLDEVSSYDVAGHVTGKNLATETQEVASFIANQSQGIRTATTGLYSTDQFKYDIKGYVDAATLYAQYKGIYENNNADGQYNARLFAKFVYTYEQTTELFGDKYVLNEEQSLSTTGTTYAAALQDAITKYLKPATEVVNDTEMKKIIQQFTLLSKNYYSAETYNALETQINACLDYYPNRDYLQIITLDKSDESQAIYDAALAKLKTAWAGLRITADTKVAVNGGNNSYNDLIAYANAFDGSKYKDFDVATSYVAKATEFMNNVPNLEFTTEADIIGQYTAVLKAAYDAFANLQKSFAGIDNGTIISRTTGSTNGSSGDDVKVYLSGAITNAVYFKTLKGSQSFTTPYNLTLDNYWRSWGKTSDMNFFGLGFGALGKDTYSSDQGKMAVRWKEGGDCLKSTNFNLSSYHDALMQTKTGEGTTNNITVKEYSGPHTILGDTIVTVGDIGISSATFTTPDIYELFLVSQTGETKQRTNRDVKQTVTVVDVSDLFETIQNAANTITKSQSNKFGCYTESSWASFMSAYNAAIADMDYTNMSTEDIVAASKQRYDDLTAAIAALAYQADGSGHVFVVQDDNKEATCTEHGWDHRICSVCGYEINKYVNVKGHARRYRYNEDGATHVVYCAQGDMDEYTEDCVNDGTGFCKYCKGALYEQADWSAYNNAKTALDALLASSANGEVKFSPAALTAAASAIESASYYNYTLVQQKTVPGTADNQSAITTQAAAIEQAVNAMNAGKLDSSVYDANVEKLATLNADAYNIAAVKAAVSGITVITNVQINGKEYAGYDFDQYNTALGTALTENTIPYKVKVIDFEETEHYLVKSASGEFSYTDVETEATEFAYGDLVTAPNPNSTNANELCAWASKEQPKSLTDAAFREMPSKYQTTYNSYTFNVQGYTELTTTSTATNSTDNVKLTFVLAYDGVETGKIVDIQYVEAGVNTTVANVANVPENIPFYEFDTFLDSSTGKALARRVKFNENTKILVNYTPLEKADYTINFVDEAGSPIDTKTANFNELVTLKANGATAYVNADNGKVLCFGSEYSFYACRNLTVKAVKSTDVKASVDVISTPVLDGSGKVYLVGSFALPQGATIKNFGFVMDGNAATETATNLTLADVDQAKQIFNLTASKYTNYGQNGNQFTISFNANAGYPSANYVAYAIYTDANGNECYAYSNVIANAAIA